MRSAVSEGSSSRNLGEYAVSARSDLRSTASLYLPRCIRCCDLPDFILTLIDTRTASQLRIDMVKYSHEEVSEQDKSWCREKEEQFHDEGHCC